MRKDIMSVLDLFREKGYACGYLTTNGTIISEERAEALADLAAAGFLKHISVSIDGPGELHDAARGLKGTFERTCAGLRRLQEAARRKHAPLRVSINTTVAHESLEALDQMVDVAEELGVDAIGLNHLMFSTPEEVAETVRLIGATDASVIATFVTPDPGLDVARVKQQVAALAEKCRAAQHPVRLPAEGPPAADGQLLHAGREARRAAACIRSCTRACRSPARSTSARSSASKSATSRRRRSKRSGTARRYVEMRRRLLEHGIFPVCRRCCKVELSPEPVAEPFPAGRRAAARDSADGRSVMAA